MNATALLDRAPIEILSQQLRQHGSCNLLSEALAGLVTPDALRQDQLDYAKALDGYGIRHEQKPIPYQGLPYVMTRRTFENATDRFHRLFDILERVIDLYLNEPVVRDFFRLQPRHDRLIRMGAGYRPRIQYCRYDFTLNARGTPRIFELNSHSPAASTYAEYFARLLQGSRCLAQLRKQGLRPVQTPLESPGAFAKAMLRSAEQSGYLRAGRQVAVLNSRYLTMNTELDHIAEQFRAEGCNVVRCFVEDLRFDGQHLFYGDIPVQLTFNKFDDTHGPDAYECAFSRTTAEVQAYLDAYEADAVFGVNSFPSMYLPEQKSTLAFLWSPLLHPYLEREEIELIEEIVPHTVLVRHMSSNELAIVAAQRERYVLKRSLDTRGRSVLIGRGATEAEWRQSLSAARAEPAGDDFVLQELAPVEHCTTRQLNDGEPTEVFTSLACFLFQGDPMGVVVRTSTEETTNVGRQGFVQPALIVE
ncbi:hypothetical protein [Dyella tabacisoli]|uniref:Glutathionylspermidine synthase pre-ATP-grasp-like domain-containing protein n=1 Tax=Dyella tabacisoli TaxID=2282381 RepID=A0A369US13_9GAMM|nr:hypothetical protein [Dyella tabacisoli]RDD83103.1 hypothetical protein DVJ77_00330 [Dyella tabacisoli]